MDQIRLGSALAVGLVVVIAAVSTGCGSNKDHSARELAALASHTLVVQQMGSGVGSVALDPPPSAEGTYKPGTSVTLTATPDGTSTFAGWGGDLNGNTTNPLTLVVQNDLRAIAVFDPQGTVGGTASAFTVTPAPPTGVAPLMVTFMDTTAGSPASFEWDFGDGNTSTDQNPVHTYTVPGSYSVTFTARDGAGQGQPVTQTNLVTVVDPTQGSRFWYVNDTYGNVYKSHDAQEAALVQQVVDLVNQERSAAGLSPLMVDSDAELAAKVHSEDMLGRGYFDHISPEGWDPNDRLRMTGATGYTNWAENIAGGQTSPADVMASWMASPGHRANILDPAFTHIGVGVAGATNQPYWTQVFLTR
jgi:uncharacterized protein YkwD